jgi:FMN phosphatase YigB (HAD superfamily)
MGQVSVILFDLGGVLLPFDQERRIAAIVQGLGVGEAAARDFMALDIHRRLDAGDADEDDLAVAFSALAGRAVSPDEACALILSVFEAPNAELWALAEALADRVAVGGFSDNPGFVRQVFPEGAVLDPMVFSSEIRACKPSPAAFRFVEARLGVAPQAILFVDDTAANVDQARARGWDGVVYRSNDQLRGELAARGLA